jgi:hypothetical protein
VRWIVDNGEIPGQFFTWTTLRIRSRRAVFVGWYDQADITINTSDYGPATLQDPDFFTQCLSQTDPGILLGCLEQSNECR